ncbi:DEAD/DEAH box helicase [Aspergillus clavatus NRRL 1]|uniref:ATP-dependent RNA helicase n=1 Tax=Aspergillus clavatus (strain ATCC 1007 / CBS 513.65 / DSM 816 / NCTC 3887 / NRRL 1 / QM 1276 / 107) TaxID=344612 RepID=A1CNP9_ASPCL|nr:DEAD box RNA helicase HelA, putative [Aspergillus clavatus NRRL 1]EAW07270.1 DEAD box RNA helicase HelA, putative [Aspergillus clavatus NRRL 1]
MLGTVRRYGVVHALRASVPRSLYKSNSQLLRWQAPSTSVFSQSVRLLHKSPSLFSAASAEAQVQTDAPEAAERHTEFSQLSEQGLVNPRIIRAIVKDMKIQTMTDVQSQTIQEILQGDDVLAQAKTGTGKTLAFLTPVLQNIMKDPSIQQGGSRRSSHASASDIRALIISPTRELAEQIAKEARRLAAHTNVVVQTAVGGTHKREGLRRIQREGCHLLVGTPGRLKDILSDHRSGVTAPNLSTLVLDEADRLLDDGFSEDIMEIQRLLPDPMKVERQTLMFSATVPKEVMKMVHLTMKPDFKFIKTVRDNEVPTHLTVPQKYVVLKGYENAFPALLEYVTRYIEASNEDPTRRPFKAIVYFNSTVQTNLAFETFRQIFEDRRSQLRDVRLFEIHSQLTQARRTRSSDHFRASRSAILFSSDVTARGMDFPDVTHVFQFSLPKDRATYIHRLGRTARANKTGEGWLFLHRGELSLFDRQLSGIPIEQDRETFASALVDMTQPRIDPEGPATPFIEKVGQAVNEIPIELKRRAYMSQMGPLRGVFDRKLDMVHAINSLVVYGYGLREPPRLSFQTARNMGIDQVPGIRLYDAPAPRHSESAGRDYHRNDRSRYSSPARQDRDFRSGDREQRFGSRYDRPRRDDRDADDHLGVGRPRGRRERRDSF